MAGTAYTIDAMIREIPHVGVYPYPDLLRVAREIKFHGVALSVLHDKKIYLLFIGGEPEGAVLADSKGELYGNKAIYLIRGDDRFTLYPLNHEVIERIVFSCRIYDKSHFTKNYTLGIPELGKKAEGIGRLIIAVKKDGQIMAGLPIRIRKDGQIVANDITNAGGIASFRLRFGKYEVLIERQENNIDVYEFSFVPELQEHPLDLEIS
jgi:hypothetical protein